MYAIMLVDSKQPRNPQKFEPLKIKNAYGSYYGNFQYLLNNANLGKNKNLMTKKICCYTVLAHSYTWVLRYLCNL